MFEDLRRLYNETILQHARAPLHAGRPEGFDAEAKGDNPMCGDRVTVFVRRAGEGVAAAGFEARGCELVRASADLMCAAVAGMEAEGVRRLAGEVGTMAKTGSCPGCGGALLETFSAVHETPSRVRCVTLPWAALVAALDGAREATSE